MTDCPSKVSKPKQGQSKIGSEIACQAGNFTADPADCCLISVPLFCWFVFRCSFVLFVINTRGLCVHDAPMATRVPGNRPDIAVTDPPFAQSSISISGMSTEVDTAIAKLARHQSGVVSRKQLIGLGLSSTAIFERVSKRRLHRVFDGVYAVGHDLVSREGRWAAALLFAGPTSCLSHRTACCLWGIEKCTSRIEVIRDFNRTNPRAANTRDRWLIVHRTRSLPARDLTRHRGFPATTVARTLLDLTPRLTDRQLRSLLATADRKGLADQREFRDILNRRTGSTGIRRFREAVSEWDPLVRVTKSDLESRFLHLRKKYKIPKPEVNVEIGDFEVDCFWRDRRVIVELDTYTFHGDTFTFEADHDRDLILKGEKFEVLRITAAMLDRSEQLVMNTLREILGI